MEKSDHQEKVFNRISLIGLLILTGVIIYVTLSYREQEYIRSIREEYKNKDSMIYKNCTEKAVNMRYLYIPEYVDKMRRCGLLEVR
ncbi:hypothetical protein A2524_00120 [Candidatus Wolfebacteria bacterium RIFOXYD12_FULL_48_21]|uniref:Uncharacterized protein n=1 Tax=Candidatus Wolfebacteria bacterium RIFOXYD1_FULL_48_65 TaxID=1802561 RepID=A0A1F8E3U4_9BACT|nr:MAG: hypothetical protein A2524_00120 [Candidatus Wolfebacteria bacterium RIFOXYD12_FULL_48_21]OGM95452.1 MAG: hypothetical protein A2610_01005 [Candidatus Wolfebacteria bacterium RIFOXYD1_FULL_48_65]OGM97131.1 MAG: hypothetical protein A2532_03085 [Candidatus Wolfebacteria bacterium RIFOXYD2_FULL_48_11]